MRVRNFDEVISKLQLHLNDYLEEKGYKTSGLFKCINPEHKDEHPSCNTMGGDRTQFHCFSCNCSGGLFKAAHFLEGKPLAGKAFIIDTLLPLAAKYNIEVESTPLTEDEIYELDTYRIYQLASEYIVTHTNVEMFQDAISA